MAQRKNTKSTKAPPRLQRAYFAERLKRLRVARGYATMRELAAVIDLTESAYRRYEKGETEPDLRVLYSMLAVLDVPATDLMGKYVVWKGPTADLPEASAQHSPGFADARQTNYAAPDFVDLLETIDRSIWSLADLYVELLAKMAADGAAPSGAIERWNARAGGSEGVDGFRTACAVFDEIKAAPDEVLARLMDQARGSPLPQSKAFLAAASELRDSLSGLF